MKCCFKCGETKTLTEFYKHKQTADGYLNKCKVCTRLDVKNNDSDYDKTEKGVVRVIYKTQKRHNKLRGHGDMEYTKSELKDWLYENNFKNIFMDWKASGFKKDLKPSVDRIDDFKSYSFDNIRLVTWKENLEHMVSDILNGTGTAGKRCRPILKTTKSGKILKEFVSYSSAKRSCGYCFWRFIGKSKPCKNGFYWKYK